jgi:hypothetical protein
VRVGAHTVPRRLEIAPLEDPTVGLCLGLAPVAGWRA